MEQKCGYCELLGKKPHCHNCKIMKTNTQRTPQKITCSLDEIIELFKSESAIEERFMPGDYFTITLYTGEEVKITYIDSQKDILADGTGRAKGTFMITGIRGRYQKSKINSNNVNDCDIEKYFIPSFMRLLPAVLVENIKPVIKPIAVSGRDNVENFERKFWLFSESEIFPCSNYSKVLEGEQYEFFKSGVEARKFGDYVWLRSPYRGDSGWACVVSEDGGYDYGNAWGFYGVVLGFCL